MTGRFRAIVALLGIGLIVLLAGRILGYLSSSPQALAGDEVVPLAEQSDPLAVVDAWPKPDVLLVVSGRQHGYIEPCGCTGLESARGGLSRRHELIKRLEQLGQPLVKLDVGNQVRRFGGQAEIKFHTTLEAMRLMEYDAIGFGPDDLRLSFGELLVGVAGEQESQSEFVCANVSILGVHPTFRVFDSGGRRIGVTAVMGQQALEKVNNQEIEIKNTKESLQAAVRALREAKVDVSVLLAHATLEETRQLARQFPEFQVIVTAGGAGEPTLQPEVVEGTGSRIVQVGTKGMYIGVLGIFSDRNEPIRYQRIQLDARFGDSKPVLEIFASYQYQLQVSGLEGLGVKPAKHPRPNRRFVGSETCGVCHTSAYASWLETPHFRATEDIHVPTERSEVRRDFDPECLSCHVTGWNFQEFFPFVSGYEEFETSSHLHGNGCENCHGPGSAHVAAENGDVEVSDAEREKLQLEMRLTLEQAKKSLCFQCHDLDNSPDFHVDGAFDRYWDGVKHYGLD